VGEGEDVAGDIRREGGCDEAVYALRLICDKVWSNDCKTGTVKGCRKLDYNTVISSTEHSISTRRNKK
jgi:hypothetical protein